MNDPLSRIIASAVALKVGTWNEATLQQAFQAASREGWKRIVLVYLETLESYYGERGNPEKARQVRRQIDLLTAPPEVSGTNSRPTATHLLPVPPGEARKSRSRAPAENFRKRSSVGKCFPGGAGRDGADRPVKRTAA